MFRCGVMICIVNLRRCRCCSARHWSGLCRTQQAAREWWSAQEWWLGHLSAHCTLCQITMLAATGSAGGAVAER